MTQPSNRTDWLIFVALGFMWGSSYLFIKLAVDDFGTFTLVALRLLVGALFLWSALRISGTAVPRDRRIYGHLLVMAIINVVIPFALITWAEQSVDSSLAAILTSPVPLFAIVLSAMFLRDEPMRVNGVAGLLLGFVGVVIITSRGLDGTDDSPLIGQLALLGATFSYAAGAVYSRRNVRGLPTIIPAVFQVTFTAAITSVLPSRWSSPGMRARTSRPSSPSCGWGSLAPGSRISSCFGCSPDGALRARRSSRTCCPSSVSPLASSSCRSRSTRASSSGRSWSSRASPWSTGAGAAAESSRRRHRSRPRKPVRAAARSTTATERQQECAHDDQQGRPHAPRRFPSRDRLAQAHGTPRGSKDRGAFA